MDSDLSIARRAQLQPIGEIAAGMGLLPDEYDLYGSPYVAKIRLNAIERLKERPNAKYVLVTAITPTPLGEGKSTTTVGLGQAMKHLGKRAVIALRQPSHGPDLRHQGRRGRRRLRRRSCRWRPFNLHLTGDIHAVTAANNLLAAMIDNQLLRGNPLNIDPDSITWRRVLDVNDRALRNIIIGLGGKARAACRARPASTSRSPAR